MLRAGDDRQRGYHHESYWTRNPDGPFCLDTHAQNLNLFPEGLPYSGQAVSMRLRKASAPADVEVFAWRRFTRKDGPSRRTELTASAPTPRIADGEVVAWDIAVPLPASFRHLYIEALVHWRDENNCGPEPDLGSQWAVWHFHVNR